MADIKEIPYSRLSPKHQARIDQAVAEFQFRPGSVYQSAISTRCTKHFRSMVTICNPTVEIGMLLDNSVKFRTRKVLLDNVNETPV